VLINQGWAPPGAAVVSSTMMPVTNSGAGVVKLRVVRQRRMTVSQLYQTLSWSKGMSGWLPWPAMKAAREEKVAVPSCRGVSQRWYAKLF